MSRVRPGHSGSTMKEKLGLPWIRVKARKSCPAMITSGVIVYVNFGKQQRQVLEILYHDQFLAQRNLALKEEALFGNCQFPKTRIFFPC